MSVLGLIGGTGLDDWDQAETRLERLEDVSTPWGRPSAPLRIYRWNERTLVFLPRHGSEHSIAPHRVNYRANIHALHAAGVQQLVAVNAVGGMGGDHDAGTLCIPDQLIDYTWGREHTYCDGQEGSLRHVEFADPFSGPVRQRLMQAARRAEVPVLDGGCIGVTQGPRLETTAEIRKLVRDGCQMVGMTTQPEAALAREAGLPYAALAVVSNLAAGVSQVPITLEDIHTTLDHAMTSARRLLQRWWEETDDV